MTHFYPAEIDRAAVDLEAALEGKRALAIGPGMPTAPEMRSVIGRLAQTAAARGIGLVLDADALNHLAASPHLVDGIGARTRLVLTPHPGEAARLSGRSTSEVQADRIDTAARLATRFDAVVALKGARTVVAAPDGRLAICPTGNPALGTGGTGDVLTGCVGALVAGGLGAFEATAAAVYLHGAAGDLVVAERGPMGLMAHDVIEALPRVVGLPKWQETVARERQNARSRA
jgi:NAD(P)H-hydrate epimerase